MTAPGGSAAVAIDLGSTRIKAGVLTGDGALTAIVDAEAPPLEGSGTIREGDARAYAEAAEGLLRELPAGCSLGISSQRSTFHLWEANGGEAATPLISWQDRRAADWCEAHRDDAARIARLTGLILSAHYAGPKLAAIQQADPGLAERLHRGELLFGNLETYLIWRATSGEVHATDPSMAARTSMLDIDAVDWSDELLELFRVPRGCLPRIEPTAGRRVELGGGTTLVATVADQASGALAVLDPDGDDALVTLGTGGFVLKPLGGTHERLDGYLTAPCLGSPGNIDRAVLEGTINGAGAMLDRLGGPVPLPDHDPTPEAFCLPDISGLGSPHWRPDLGLTFSPAAERLDQPQRQRIATEGLLFRVRHWDSGRLRGCRRTSRR